MCDCAMTSFDVLDMLNAKRIKAGFKEVGWDFMMIQHRSKIRFYKPVRKIGQSLIWDKSTAKKIVDTLYKIRYVPRGSESRAA
jgi:hypothetical protein